MYLLIVLIFVIGYLAIALEHPLHVNKAASAMVTGVLIWVVLMVGELDLQPDGSLGGHEGIVHHLLEHLGDIASILFFLMGAMTVVELIDAHEGFRIITDRITGTKKVPLMWVLSIITFFLSAALDNMTTAIVMCALLRKLIRDKDDLWTFAGMVIIAANAGGSWSPIGDVTTIMLWIGGQVTAVNIIGKLFLPSLVCLILPLIWYSFTFRGTIMRPEVVTGENTGHVPVTSGQSKLIFTLGLMALLGVPLFKTYTHLPPYMGILLGLGILWIVTERMHKNNIEFDMGHLSVTSVLRRIDTSSILFFLGILTAVSGLQVAGHLTDMAMLLDTHLGNMYAVNSVIGVLSSIVDNVPLVAAAMGMYPMTQYPQDHQFWELLAYCAGTGGSILIIGSAAGVAAMGILGIDFIWYVRRIAFPAVLGYIGGIITFWLLW
ncbi:MAG TPA: sodium:proton antiporter NhaD [Flavobacteriales bacterium]|nr:sodium:proton antiporter NhaD [Flavobacteriales bacterium]MBK7100679.1 sodium:proton antiporter NhaD [Flavobacteriales bacterium]MBK7618237.1 sodium:proton antiporter NhaD [Flavobacteriales bacterium]MBK8532987.1 sodium:proton antiporter NhaD [Flavobacteriales bacterium]MBP9177580.1 sodium:proton antiporter NhaD [Flavobacteriales bacterium]